MNAGRIIRTAAIVGHIGGLRAEGVAYMLDRYRREPTREHMAALDFHARGLARFTVEQAEIANAARVEGEGFRERA